MPKTEKATCCICKEEFERVIKRSIIKRTTCGKKACVHQKRLGKFSDMCEKKPKK